MGIGWRNKGTLATGMIRKRTLKTDRIGRLMTVGLMANEANHWNGLEKDVEFERTDRGRGDGETGNVFPNSSSSRGSGRRERKTVERRLLQGNGREKGTFKSVNRAANKPQIRRHLSCQGTLKSTRRWQLGWHGDSPRESSRQAERDNRGTRSTSEGRMSKRKKRKSKEKMMLSNLSKEEEQVKKNKTSRKRCLPVNGNIENCKDKNTNQTKRYCQPSQSLEGEKNDLENNDYGCFMKLEVSVCCRKRNFSQVPYVGYSRNNVYELNFLPFKEVCTTSVLLKRSNDMYDNEVIPFNDCGDINDSGRCSFSASYLTDLMESTLTLTDGSELARSITVRYLSQSLSHINTQAQLLDQEAKTELCQDSFIKQPSFLCNFRSSAPNVGVDNDDDDLYFDGNCDIYDCASNTSSPSSSNFMTMNCTDRLNTLKDPHNCGDSFVTQRFDQWQCKMHDSFHYACDIKTNSHRATELEMVALDDGSFSQAILRDVTQTIKSGLKRLTPERDIVFDCERCPTMDTFGETYQDKASSVSVVLGEEGFSRIVTLPLLKEKVSVVANKQETVSILNEEQLTSPTFVSRTFNRNSSQRNSSCEGLGGSVVSPTFQSVNNEKLPYEKPFKGLCQGWSLPFALMMLLMLLPQTLALPAVIRIGAIFTEDQRDSATELAFKYAVYRINNDKIILPNTTLVFDIQYAPRDDSFHTAKKACKQITFGVQAIFGPFEPLLGSHIQSITDALDIPHLEARLDMEPQEKEFSINLYPSHQFLNQAYKDMIQFLKWKKVAIIYEEDFGLMKLQEIIRSPPSKSIEIYIRQGHPENYRDILKEVKHKEIYSIIVDTLPENMNMFLRCLLQLQMNDYRYHYLFTTFDIETFDLEDFKYNFVNMTAFRLVDTDNVHVKRTLRDMERFQPIGHSILNKSAIIQAEPALIYDSVNVFAKGLHALERSATLSLANLSCESETPWPDGSSLFNYINAVEYNGVTGPIKFTEGRRSNFKLDILKLRMEKLYKVGEWTPDSQINITDHHAFFEGGKPNITLKVITIEETPFVMIREASNLTGNNRYEGFCVDLLSYISNMAGFDYEIVVSGDGLYGLIDTETGEWNGLVRGLMDKKADLAVGSMTINYARESVIDFTKPFMNLGVSILFKVPQKIPTRLFSFMNPLAVEIWLYILAAYIVVSTTIYIVARFSPYEWQNPNPCHHNTEIMENDFTLGNSFWFTIGTLMQQGSDLNPKAASTRIVGGIWWFFTLIIISSYTANLAAFLTVERMITPIESAEDLAEQNEIEYGTLEGGSTMAFFRDSKIETYQKMWRYMESKRPSVFVPTIEEGVQRVLRGDYAFLMESTMLDYTIQRNCNLTQVGGLLNSNSYGIATPIGSPWRDKISLAILELQEKGIIQMLYSKWWKNTGDVCNRDEKNKDSKANALGVENIGGVFVVLLCGLALAIVVAILEFCWNSRKNAQTDRQSLCSEMAEELRFAMRCQGSRQRPALKRNCSRCTPGTTYVPAVNDLPQANGVSSFLVPSGSCSSHRHPRGSAAAQASSDTYSLPPDLTPPPPAPPPPPFPFPPVVPSTYGITSTPSIPLPLASSSSLSSLPPPPSPLSCT